MYSKNIEYTYYNQQKNKRKAIKLTKKCTCKVGFFNI